MLRLFVALDPSESVRGGLSAAIALGKKLAPDAKWVEPTATHLTVFFLGWVPDDAAPEIVRVLTPVSERQRAFEVSFYGAGTFGSELRPRLLWAGLRGDQEGLSTLYDRVTEALVAIGFKPEERAYAPHVTLARARGRRGDPALARAEEALAAVDLGTCTMSELVLYESKAQEGKSRYLPLSRFAFGA